MSIVLQRFKDNVSLYLLGSHESLESCPIRNHQGRALECDELPIPEVTQCTSDCLTGATDEGFTVVGSSV